MNLNEIDALTIRTAPTENDGGGFNVDVFDNEDYEGADAQGGGQCTGDISDALEMARSEAQDIINRGSWCEICKVYGRCTTQH